MRPYAIATVLGLAAGFAGLWSVQAGGKQQPIYAPGVKMASTGCTLPYDDHNKAIICTNRSIPPNWVIVGVRHTPGCNGLCNNSWVIQRLPNYPGADIIICSCQPIPPGWAVVEEVKTHYCGHGNHGVRIRKM